ncbi:Transmembrane protein 65 [Strongyloides ratti]|uniref:Transmembrane protein 65 n=1 Tax=Strongyloides ratti TaxID=34506 RepID=A0A090KPB1_STRRB|nr:Transmembrane protein 65 [Strongyloides ratti]CEF59438.1 Transmembrane protein 65 [Strongyloides ratti]
MTILLNYRLLEISRYRVHNFIRHTTNFNVNNARNSTTAASRCIETVILRNEQDAKKVIYHFSPEERDLLLKALQKDTINDGNKEISKIDGKKLFLFNAIPFVGFGILDNMIMIIAGEYIDQQIGTIFTISTMAAAALGNTISDVSGVGLAHYVEIIVGKFGIKHPDLSADQLNSKKGRLISNFARAFGLVVGCTIGMFPLLFFNNK